MPEGDRAALLRLAGRLGIAGEYHDLWGQRHAAASEDLAALCAQFDVDAGGPDAIAAAERALDAAARPLPPVLAVGAGVAGWPLRLGLPETPPGPLRWVLTEEGGATHHGELAPADGAAATDGRREWRIALALPAGYHRLRLPDLDADAEALLIAAPERCYRPPALQGEGRVWGPSLQLYALRSERNWGIGDFGDLAVVIEQWARLGAGIVGLNPLHALFAHNPAHISPYSPSSRLQLNVLYIDVDAVAELRDCAPAQALRRSAEFQDRLARLRDNDEVDHLGVAAAKFEVLRLLHAHFRAQVLAGDGERARDFRDFRAEGGAALRRHACFEALQAHFHAEDREVWGWPVWPAAWRDPEGEAVQRFVAEHAADVEFHEYLQWLADRQLRALSRRCRALGLAVGLYLDLAVSVDRAGSDTWGHQDVYAVDASVGAPPDDFNPNGQGWGLPPLRPDRLRASGHALFIATLRAAMRHAGALRIDHVMALMRLFWIPPGKNPSAGAYVHYPFDELLAIVLLESHRNRCVVIGEDLGTVADAVREAMARTEMLSYRLLYFERGAGGDFTPPADYPREALVAVSTHDLATLAGWWSGHDLGVRLALGLLPDRAAHEAQRQQRAEDRRRLLQALQREGLFDGDVEQAADGPLTPALLVAVHACLAQAPSRVLMLQLDDVLGVVDQANLPGTTDEHANWRRKLPVALERMAARPEVGLLAGQLARLRPHAPLAAAALRCTPAIVPRATYRLQFHAGFDFEAAIRLLPYLQRLGISHVYGSPVTRARPGSRHGYDVVAHHEINPELGGRAGFERFCAALRAHGMGQLLDLVPNHMGVLGGDNAWWLDVLEHGPASAHARWFDIDWQPVNRDLHGKVLLPVLGGHYGEVLERGELGLQFDAARGSFAVRYFEHRFPLDPRSYPMLLDRALPALQGEAAAADALAELRALSAAFAGLPPRDAEDRATLAQRAREQAELKRRLATLASAPDGAARRAIEAAAAALGCAHDVDSADALDALLDVQAWRLAYWRVAADEINYRRFFDINELAALRIEDPAVFEATQGMALDLAAAGRVDGLRIDHPDGLFDPARYFARLQQGHARRAGLAPPLGDDKPLYVVVEKIAAAHEEVPRAWPVHGTTGYRFAMLAGGVLIDAGAQARIDRIWRQHANEPRSFAAIAHEAKRDILRGSLASELTALTTECRRIARADRASRDHSVNTLREALAEIAACMPVYRTYVDDDGPSAQDVRYIDWAVAQARKRSRDVDTSVFDFLHGVLLGRSAGRAPAAQVLRFARRFQQFCAPVAAKGVEDTAYYRYARLVALNEVGGDPATFGVSVRAFHGASAERAQHYPHTVLATSTHDNKRSEDVRTRLGVLSELPAQWRLGLRRWRTLTARLKARPDPAASPTAPSATDEILLVQTLLGTLPAGGLDEASLPAYRERIAAYMLKAVREAKRDSSWVNPDAEYERALADFLHGLLGRVQPNPVLAELQAQADRLAWFGALTSLSLVLLKLTSPGVPDIYQGNELMDLSLVDPDNRRPIDFALRERLLEELAALAAQPGLAARLPALLAAPHDGRAKLWFTWRLLQLRARLPALFRDGGYTALAARGRHAGHVLAYARSHAGTTLVVVAGRLFARLLHATGTLPLGDAAWADTEIELPLLADGTRLDDALSGRTLAVERGALRVSHCLASLPGAALVARSDPG